MNKILTAASLFLMMTYTSIGYCEDKAFKDDTFTTILSKKFDFSDTAITGEAATPTGFMLRGRNNQQLSQLVTLRKDFSEFLKSSSEGAKVVTK